MKACIAFGVPVPAKVGVARFFLTALYLGLGNPLGVESPTLHICAAVSCALYSVAARCFGSRYFPEENVTTMVIIGSSIQEVNESLDE